VANNSKVLVHCQAGVSRSPTIVIAYLMRKLKLKMNDAYGKVREKRPIVAPNLIFMSQLMDFELSLFKEQPPQPAIADITMNSSDSMVIDCETTETRVHA
jgi:dual specificity MAP kinase phosphatase